MTPADFAARVAGLRAGERVAVIGLGYVGLPLVVEFGKQVRTIGFDIAKNKVEACQRGTDPAANARSGFGSSSGSGI